MIKIPEGKIVKQILDYLKLKGHKAGKTKTMGVKRGSRFCFDPYLFTGFPDITAFVPHLVFIEVKAKGGKQSPKQREFQWYCERAKIKYILAYSLEDVRAELW